MRLAPEVHITLIDNEKSTSLLWLHGQPTSTVVDGIVLEAALAWRDCYLLFLCDGNPFEDVIHIHFLGATGCLLDTALVYFPYISGKFQSFQITGPDQFFLEFFANDRLLITLYPKPRFRIPFLEAPGVMRPFKWWRCFSIRRLHARQRRVSKRER